MNFQSIKFKFILHLREISINTGIEAPNLDTSDLSIFSHQEEFKQFLKDEYNIKDTSLTSVSITDLMNMTIVDGKLVDKKKVDEETSAKEADTETPETNATEPTTNEEKSENSWITDMLSNLLDDEEFIKNIDGSSDGEKNGQIEEEEFNEYINYIKNIDKDNENLSVDDILASLEMMKEGTFEIKKGEQAPSLESTDEDTETKPEEETPKTESEKPTQSPKSSGGGGGGGNSGGGGSTVPSSNNNDTAPKTLENMNEEELNKELSTAKATYDTNKSTLDAISNDTYQDSELDELKKKMDEDYAAYKEALNPEEQEELDKITARISEAESNIAKKEVEIAEQEVTVSSAQSAYDSAKATCESYNAAVSELEAKTNDSSLSAEKKADISSKLSGAKAKLEAAEKDKKAKEEALKNEKEKLETLKGELETLKTGENGLEALNQQKAEIEDKIKTETPDAAELMNTYNESKSKYEAKKAELRTKAIADVKEAQDRINEINVAKNNLADKTAINKNYKASSIDDFFGQNIEYSTEFIRGAMNYQLVVPKNVDPDEELPILIDLHGLGGNASNVLSSDYMYFGNQRNWNYDDFKGIIICPILEDGAKDWLGDHDQKLRSIINDVCATHKVNKERICLVGGSMGGGGAIYMADRLKDILYRTASFSAVNAGVDTRVLNKDRKRIRGWYGSLDPNWNKTKMKEQFAEEDLTVIEGANHGQVPGRVYSIDADGNNRSDIMEWLYGD